MTYQEAAQSALDIQGACNLSGVVFSFAEAMHAICEEQHRIGEGTEWKNTHPIVTLYLDKLASLNGYPLILASDYSDKFHACACIAEGRDYAKQ